MTHPLKIEIICVRQKSNVFRRHAGINAKPLFFSQGLQTPTA
jgi:hypothetical protein